MQRRQRLAFEANEPVRIVLQHQQIVRLRELYDTLAALERQCASAGVLERRDQIQEGGRRRSRVVLERVGIEAIVVAIERNDLRPELAENLERAVVRGPSTSTRLPGASCCDEEDEPLQRPVGEQDA